MAKLPLMLIFLQCMASVRSLLGGKLRDDRTDVRDRPNVIFMMADDLGWGDVHYNNGTAQTPNLDEMSKAPGSLLLHRYYSGGPVCSPTRGTVLTGRNHNRYCVWTANTGNNKPDFAVPEKMPLPLSEFTVAEAAKQQGYTTAMYGKWHLGDFFKLKGGNPKWPVSHPGKHGFDEWMATERSTPTATTNCGCFTPDHCITGHYKDNTACNNYWGEMESSKSESVHNLTTPILGDDSLFLGNMSEQFIRKAVAQNKPFLLYLPFHTVHIRFIAVEPFASMYKNLNFTADEIDYFGAITAMDVQVGRLRALLRELKIENDTILWFASDNGPEDGTPGTTNGLRGRKRDLTEGGIRVPGLLEWPAVVESNRHVDSPIVSSDLLPTLLDIWGAKMPDDRPVDGQSALAVINGTTSSRPEPIGFAYNVPRNFSKGDYHSAWVDNQYKIFAEYKSGELAASFLYDLTKDLGETTDLSMTFPDIKKKMLSEMEDWRQSVIESATHEVGCYGISAGH